ncbi:MAG: site-specific integrase [Gammaproteobacteria bacterium]|nr:site-specific integrase [Gammaproteobacteria bacterium]
MARRWVVLMDDLALEFKNDPTKYGHAQCILARQPQHLPSTIQAVCDAIDQGGVLRDPTLKSAGGAHLEGRGRLSGALERYIIEKKKVWNPKSTNGNERDVRLKIETFIGILGDLPCQQLQSTHIATYKNSLFKLPANRSKLKIYRDLNISKLLELGIPEHHKLGNETLGNHFNKVSGFLDWCHRNGLMGSNLKLPLSRVIVKSKSAPDQRDVFDDNDLMRLFNSGQYLSGSHKKPSHYFVPLLGLFTGARLNELCQLYCSDVYQEKGTNIWVLDINADTDDKRLKRATHTRLVPLHPALIELGFVDYIQNLKTQRVFPELTFKRDGYGQTLSRWFNEIYRSTKHCNVGQSPSEHKNFHSFRHGFITQLGNDFEVPQHKIAHIVGHRPSDGSETIQRYTKPTDLIDRYEIIKKLRWGSVDFTQIKTPK